MFLKKLDYYIAKEIYPIFFISYFLYTFLVLIGNIFNLIDLFITYGAEFFTVIKLIAYMIPVISPITIPVSFLTAVLMGISRLTVDAEYLAMRSLGISFMRLTKSVFFLSIPVFLLTLYITTILMPSSNYAFTKNIITMVIKEVEGYVKPNRFVMSFPNTALYIKDKDKNGWKDVFIYDSSSKNKKVLIISKSAKLIVNKTKKKVELYLFNGRLYVEEKEKITGGKFTYFVKSLPSFGIFESFNVGKRADEMNIKELLRAINTVKSERVKSYLISLHKRFSIPFSVFIFALLGVVLGTIAGKGSFAVSIGVVLSYYILLLWGENLAFGNILPVFFGEWLPNIVLLLFSLYLLFRKENFSDVSLLKFKRLKLFPRKTGKKEKKQLLRILIKFPNYLDRYIGKIFLLIFFASSIAFLGIFLTVSFLELVDDIIEHKKSFSLLFKYLYYYSPQMLIFIIPMAVLLSSLLTFGILERNNETTAMKAGGVSLYRVTYTVIIFSIFFSFLNLYLQEKILPTYNKNAYELRREIQGRKKRVSINFPSWVKGKRGFFYHFNFYDKKKGKFKELNIYQFDDKEKILLKKYESKEAYIKDKKILLIVSKEFTIGENSSKVEKHRFLELKIPDNKSIFSYEFPDPEEMNIKELKGFIAYLKENNASTKKYLVSYYFKLFFPFTPIVLVFVGISFAFKIGRSGTLAGIGIAIFITFIYWIIFGVLKSLGNAGILTPILSGSGANFLFLFIGLYFYSNIKT